ncbi:MAG: hypothetical protein WD708_00830 [Kiritimatiellia bacterium]
MPSWTVCSSMTLGTADTPKPTDTGSGRCGRASRVEGVRQSTAPAAQWKSDPEILLNSAVLGAPGSNLRLDRNPSPRCLLQRRALHRWYRRGTRWEPLWLDSETGGLSAEPRVRSLGRMEPFADGPALTALALRRESHGLTGHPFVEVSGSVMSALLVSIHFVWV